MAERQGFEPWVPFRVHTLSKRAPSATRPSLRWECVTRNAETSALSYCNLSGGTGVWRQGLVHSPSLSCCARSSQKTSDGKATGYAYGWGVHEENGVRTVGHTGGQPGCSSALWMLPEQGFAVTIMANTDEVKVLPIAEALAQAYLAAHAITH